MKKDHILDNIISVTKKLLNNGGPDAVTMVDIAKALDITAPTLYHYFKGKDEIIQGTNKLYLKELTQLFEIPLPASISPKDRLTMIIIQFSEYLYNNPYLISHFFAIKATQYYVDLSSIRAKLKELASSVTEKNRISQDMAANTLLALTITSAYALVNKKKTPDFGKEGEKIVQIFLKCLS